MLKITIKKELIYSAKQHIAMSDKYPLSAADNNLGYYVLAEFPHTLGDIELKNKLEHCKRTGILFVRNWLA